MPTNTYGQRIDITNECKADARERLRKYLVGVRVWDTPFRDAEQVLTDWLGGFQAKVERLQADLDTRDAAIQTAVIEPLEAKVERLRRELKGMTEARNRFCSNLNQIGRLFWGKNKDQYAPDAVIRGVERLRAEVEALKSERKPHTQLCAELIQLRNEVQVMQAAKAGGEK